MTLNLPEQEICNLYLNGMSEIKISLIYKCASSSIGRILKSNNIKKRCVSRHRIELPINEICNKYLSGMTMDEIGKDYKCNRVTIRNRLLENGIKLRSRCEVQQDVHVIELPIDEICNKYINGASMTDLENEYGCNRGTIKNRLLECNIEIRNNSETKKLIFKNNPELSEQFVKKLHEDLKRPERISAGHQGQDYDKGEWTGWTDKSRPHLKREQDCIKLNQRLIEGSDAHHLTSGIIIYLPRNLHRIAYGGIAHMLRKGDNTGYGMELINNIAFNYLINGI